MKRRLVSRIQEESRVNYSVTGKKVKLQTSIVKKSGSLGQSKKKSSNILPNILLVFENVEIDYRMQTADQLNLLCTKNPFQMIDYHTQTDLYHETADQSIQTTRAFGARWCGYRLTPKGEMWVPGRNVCRHSLGKLRRH